MGIDMRRPLIAAIEAALDEINSSPPQKKHKGGAGRALLVGAGLVTAGRLAMSARGRGLLESLQERLPTEAIPHMHGDDESREDDAEFDEPEDEEDEDFDDEADEEPEGEEDEDFDEEAEEEPQGEEDVDDAAADEPVAEDESEDVDDEADDEPVAEDESDETEDEEEPEPEPEPAPKRRSRSRATTKSRR